MNTSLLAPAPPAVSLEEHIRRSHKRFGNGIKFPEVPRVWSPDFIGPRQPFSMANFYDPRPNVPGQTFWGD